MESGRRWMRLLQQPLLNHWLIAVRWGEHRCFSFVFWLCKKNALSYSSSVVPCQSVNGEKGLQGKTCRYFMGKTSAQQWSKKLCICSTFLGGASTCLRLWGWGAMPQLGFQNNNFWNSKTLASFGRSRHIIWMQLTRVRSEVTAPNDAEPASASLLDGVYLARNLETLATHSLQWHHE